MVKAMIDINEEANKVLNIIKAKYGLKDKSEAINLIAMQYAEEFLEPKLRPEYIAKIRKMEKQKPIKIGSAEEFRNRLGLK